MANSRPLKWKIAAIVAIAFFPAPALANAGTPLIWAGMFHLFLGNAIIGIFEGLLLAKFFGVARNLSINLLVVANYASAWAGILLLPQWAARSQNLTLENIELWLGILVAAAFLLTLLVEFPFFWFLLRDRKNSFWKALKAIFIIHGISYICLFGWYGANSQTSLLTQLELVPIQQLQASQKYALYFISMDGKQLMRARLNGEPPEQVKEFKKVNPNEEPCFRQNERQQFDLFALVSEKQEPIISDFAKRVPLSPEREDNSCNSTSFGRALKLTKNSNWEYETSVWAAGGIMGFNRKKGSRIHFALETPFAFWNVSHATHLEGDLVVFQLHKNQMCLLDPQARKIALIARGSSPVVVEPK
ncbi:hypothetical protein [Oscillatoria sp. FACHB-1406]|uniref:hypothetical protein n=1 Tax=Oscillatoria sp. FACHB-1406 TaxID=2692846 RepID=UPI00168617FB|nr:hypothetical protein [Oscillatoria sp. FACHB-1406]MBD2580459.1 hypothetical protein [Oscillatoria sp. FACHB-1406]